MILAPVFGSPKKFFSPSSVCLPQTECRRVQNKCTLIFFPLQPFSLSQPRAFLGEREIPSPEGGFLPPLFLRERKVSGCINRLGGGFYYGYKIHREKLAVAENILHKKDFWWEVPWPFRRLKLSKKNCRDQTLLHSVPHCVHRGGRWRHFYFFRICNNPRFPRRTIIRFLPSSFSLRGLLSPVLMERWREFPMYRTGSHCPLRKEKKYVSFPEKPYVSF